MFLNHNDKDFNQYKNKLINHNNQFSIFYSKEIISYYKSLNKKKFKDISFIYKNNNYEFLFYGYIFSKNIFNIFNIPCSAFFNTNKISKKESKLIINKLDQQLNCKVKFLFEDFIVENKINFISNYLLKFKPKINFGFYDFIDLSQAETDLWSNLRKSYKSLINKTNKQFEFKYYKKTITEKDFNLYKKLHKTVSGKKTRNNNSWKIQFKLIKEGMGNMMLAYDKKKIISGALFFNNTHIYNYGSSCILDEYKSTSVGHSMIWNSIIASKKQKFKKYLINWGTLGKKKNNKISKIDYFKSGFGHERTASIILEKN